MRIRDRVPFTAAPYYYYEPLQVNIGNYREELATEDPARMLQLAARIKKQIDEADVASLYILSLRLYDLGQKDEAYYWFLTAQSRARILGQSLDRERLGGIGAEGFELVQFFSACNQLIGEYLNGYGFNDIDKALATFEKVRSEMPAVQPYDKVYPTLRFAGPEAFAKARQAKIADLTEGIEYISSHKDEMRKQRMDAGVQGKY